MVALQNIAWVGTGKVGLPILQRVLSASLFNVKLLVRNPISSYPQLPSGIEVHQVDYANHSTLVQQLLGQDAVIIFSTFAPGAEFDKKHIALVNAAIEAGVKYFLPSEWALDTAGIMGSTSERYGPTLPTNYVLAPKRVSHNYLLCRAAEGEIRFAALYPGVLVEACFKNGLFAFDFGAKKALLPDGGINPFPASSFASLSRAIITLFANPSLISNRFYHMSDGVLTQREILQIVERESGSVWEKSSFSVDEVRNAAADKMMSGLFGLQEFRGTLMTPFFGGLQVWRHVDNEVLKLGEGEDLRDVIRTEVRARLN